MAKGSRPSGSGGGGGAAQAAQTTQPQTVEGENTEFVVRMDNGERKNVNVSIQDTSQYEELKGVDYARKAGSHQDANVYRTLASQAEQRALDPKNDTFTEPTAKEGKLTKTDKVPVMKNNANNQVLESTTGYVTSQGGENFYIQKVDSREWATNYKGVKIQGYKSLDAAKKGLSGDAQKVLDMGGRSNSPLNTLKGQFTALSRNNGKISRKVAKEMDFGWIAGRR